MKIAEMIKSSSSDVKTVSFGNGNVQPSQGNKLLNDAKNLILSSNQQAKRSASGRA